MQAECRAAGLIALPDAQREDRRTHTALACLRTDAAAASAPASASTVQTAHGRRVCARGFAAEAGPHASADVAAELDAFSTGVFCRPRPLSNLYPCQPHSCASQTDGLTAVNTLYKLGSTAEQMSPSMCVHRPYSESGLWSIPSVDFRKRYQNQSRTSGMFPQARQTCTYRC